LMQQVFFMAKHSLFLVALLTLTVNISGCGGGSSATSTTVTASTVQGIVAAGNPVSGTVYLSDSSTPVTAISAEITDAGEFSIDTKGLKPPFILKSVDSLNNMLFSYANAPGNVNINPLSTLAVAVAAGVADSNSLSILYDDYTQGASSAITQMQGISKVITEASSHITSSLQPLLTPYGAENADPLFGPYIVNNQGLDGLFNEVAITISNGTVVITRQDNNTTVFTASLSDLMTSASAGTVVTNNIPAPAPYVLPGNAILRLKLQGSLPQGELVKNASFSIQLPLGTTVVTPASAPAVVTNTVIPMGTATGANIYPTPTLSPTNNTLQITMSSVSGFGTGNFLSIRYTDANTYYMHKRTPSDFVVSGSQFFSDIYKTQKLQKLTIVPDSITFP
jgi:hypothetical protein